MMRKNQYWEDQQEQNSKCKKEQAQKPQETKRQLLLLKHNVKGCIVQMQRSRQEPDSSGTLRAEECGTFARLTKFSLLLYFLCYSILSSCFFMLLYLLSVPEIMFTLKTHTHTIHQNLVFLIYCCMILCAMAYNRCSKK